MTTAERIVNIVMLASQIESLSARFTPSMRPEGDGPNVAFYDINQAAKKMLDLLQNDHIAFPTPKVRIQAAL